jgi:hypothetical protein
MIQIITIVVIFSFCVFFVFGLIDMCLGGIEVQNIDESIEFEYDYEDDDVDEINEEEAPDLDLDSEDLEDEAPF